MSTIGIMNDETREVMQAPRCGLSDEAESSGRSKRYTLKGLILFYYSISYIYIYIFLFTIGRVILFI